ncbi:hypothetical protein [Actibacterium pelagium]|uniref:Uncharacterized protein n=1 Tax=Actibacterium pelagium TaxID=2029103 RepID=A0A917ACX5_9RHOB|nr:hypothetical protein [Actibacterium pelagium]GGE42184.1 hypothetical protein GCM10011517_07250 [Actibacterium pelagium]
MSIKVFSFAAMMVASSALAQGPDSAIDWLSDSVSLPPEVGPLTEAPTENGPNLLPEPVTVTPLSLQRIDAVGLLPGSVTGLSPDIWAGSDPMELARLIRAEQVDDLPAAQSLLYLLLLAELNPPTVPGEDGTVLLARLDKLLQLGAIDQAQALLERAGPNQPQLFRRWFDVSLLTGHENRACAAMIATPEIAPTFPARIFCLARGEDWNAAALSLETGKVLGFITEEEENVLLQFLDPELAEELPPLGAPSKVTPLVFRMYEAIGTPLATGTLPIAFAWTDLSETSGWRARIEAAERLSRSGALSPNQLLAIYTERKPAASGGVWDRVKVVQDFDVASIAGSPELIAETLPAAWKAMQAARLEVPFANLYVETLAKIALQSEAQPLAFQIGLLSDRYESVALSHTPLTKEEAFLHGVATDNLALLPPISPEAAVVKEAFVTPDQLLSTTQKQLLANNRDGEAILMAIDLLSTGVNGDSVAMGAGLALLRKLGLVDTARRAALQWLILQRRG